ncbi:MAG: 23S rRNA (pseudouridine(1915)-N(3))-methyltransferase RlmH [Burkholderiaceae bacterium]|nr:23S rRNA (pseudouridine(1915)-N(3))-methyltransferase RlmH [Burkholderiaceae bacterium]
MILILAVGQKQPAWVREAMADYLGRFPAEHRPTLKEIKAEPRTSGKTVAAMMAAEAERIEAATPKDTLRIALDERGKALTSDEFCTTMGKLQKESTNIAFMIGGPDGLDPTLKTSCHQQVRLSSMTLPHGLARVLLAEQLYRAWSLQHHHPYHRA